MWALSSNQWYSKTKRLIFLFLLIYVKFELHFMDGGLQVWGGGIKRASFEFKTSVWVPGSRKISKVLN